MKKPLLALLVIFSLFSSDVYARKAKILLGTPVRQKPAIFKEFLASLERLDQKNYSLDYVFVDDTVNPETKALINDFAKRHRNCTILYPEGDVESPDYICNDVTHFWKDAIVWKVARFKDRFIEMGHDKGYDYVFLVDSDTLLHPKTISQLMTANKEIITNILWTSWAPNTVPMPQVWMSDEYTFYEQKPGENLTDEEKNQRFWALMEQLKEPGVYEVGAFGGLHLISKSALKKGVRFEKIKNLSFWGEDRHFCVRAAALGISLWVDTHYPAYHIYRESDLAGVAEFVESCNKEIASK